MTARVETPVTRAVASPEAINAQCAYAKSIFGSEVEAIYAPDIGLDGDLKKGPDEVMDDAYRVSVRFMEDRGFFDIGGKYEQNVFFRQAKDAVIAKYTDGTYGVFGVYDTRSFDGKTSSTTWGCHVGLSYDKWKLIKMESILSTTK